MPLTDQLTDILSSLRGFGPEIWLSVSFCLLLIAELIFVRVMPLPKTRRYLAGLSVLVLLVAGLWAVYMPTRGFLFTNLLFVDNQAIFIQAIVALGAILVVLYEFLSFPQAETGQLLQVRRGVGVIRQPGLPFEWYSLLVAMTLGLFLMAMSVNMLSIYLSIELVSICSYLLTALTTSRKASEGGIKYLLFGAVSSAIMLYGMSLLYGMTGTLDLTADAFGAELARQEGSVVAVAMLLTAAGLLFKLAGVPFHIWTPDAYEAAPIPVAAFFSVGPKAAAVLVLMRVITALPAESGTGGTTAAVLQTPLAVLALAGILIGNLSALRQTEAKRLLAYSTIAHAGFLLVGVVALNNAGFEAGLFYVGTYLFMSLAAFFLVDLLARSAGVPQNEPLTIHNFAGLGAKQPLLAIALTVVMLGLTGLPPTVGFTAKLLAFSALYEAYQQTGDAWLLALFALGLLNALISLVYYLKIPFLLFFRPIPTQTDVLAPVVLPKALVWLAVSLTLPVVLLFLKPDLLLYFIDRQ
ncbi:NADH-quinone oxidoreductase subunit N [Spirosoma radiotolerans]|uniref:NADH-quinone oxidoreductase subunit N n=1 Tax=Spirosoma radiotolerans TaxID=1379870 RepID=A0A0E4A061_9BACT|nr:NADH-quinone oxidoreductase subunit N [Spirosoma radiotolerans]AKD58304.1 NADH-quinone oxidoreductase subunit N [Spirosoma radiotolerans]